MEGGGGEGSETREEDAGSLPSLQVPAGGTSCGLCLHKPFTTRTELYRHYSSGHFSENLKQFVNVKERSCTICGKVFNQVRNVLRHVGAVHDKVEQFLDPSLHVRKKGQSIFDQTCSEDKGEGKI